jgi:hypothetical protein
VLTAGTTATGAAIGRGAAATGAAPQRAGQWLRAQRQHEAQRVREQSSMRGRVQRSTSRSGPTGGRVGSLIVGAAEGLGGRLSERFLFFGWNLAGFFFRGELPRRDH